MWLSLMLTTFFILAHPSQCLKVTLTTEDIEMDIKLTRKAISPKEAALSYGFSEGTLANMRNRREGPLFYKRGRKVVYFISDFERWLKESPVLTKDAIEY
jgi:hypothetical protein